MKNIKFLRAYDGSEYGWDNKVVLYDEDKNDVDEIYIDDYSSWDILEILEDEGYIDVERDEYGEPIETKGVVWSNFYVLEDEKDIEEITALIREAEKKAGEFLRQKEIEELKERLRELDFDIKNFMHWDDEYEKEVHKEMERIIKRLKELGEEANYD